MSTNPISTTSETTEAQRQTPMYDYVRRYSPNVRLAAGTGTPLENEDVADHVAFHRDWMRRRALRAERCSLVEVAGDSMSPELLDGDTVLVDHSRREPVAGKVFALQTAEGPVVKRLRRGAGRWWASSDNDASDQTSRALDAADAIIGCVVWQTHKIVDGEPQPARR